MYSVRDFRSNFKLIWIFSQIFMKVPNVQFHGKPSSWSHADKSGRTERQADMAKVTGNLTLRRVRLIFVLPDTI